MFKKILVGYDGSDGGKAALDAAVGLAKQNHAELVALWVRSPLPRYSDLPGEIEDESEEAAQYFKERCQEVESTASSCGISIRCDSRPGHPARVMVDFADEGHFDLIVVGHSDHSHLWGKLLGDTADRISDHAHCSVLIVK